MGFVVWFFAGALWLSVLKNGFHWQWLAPLLPCCV